MVDRRKLQVGHGFICGMPGSGTEHCAKHEIMNTLRTSEDQVIVIDFYGNYVSLAQEVGGKVVDFSLSNPEHAHINLFDTHSKYIEGDDIVQMKLAFYVAFFECILGGNLSALQTSIIIQCLRSVYKEYIESFNKKTGEFDEALIPIFSDFYDELRKQPGFDAYVLTQALKIYNSGPFDWFSKKTDVSFDDKFIVFKFDNASYEQRSLLALVALELVKDHCVNSVDDRAGGYKKIWLYIDELNFLLRHDCGDEYLECLKSLSKVSKRYGCILTFVTRKVSEVLEDNNSRPLFVNCDFVQMLNQTPSDCNHLVELLGIPEYFVSYITGKPAGEGLIQAGKSYFPFRLIHDEKSNSYEMKQSNLERNETNNALILGTVGKSTQRRCYEATEFKPELVPDYVDTIKIVTDPNTRKRYFTYVDDYGRLANDCKGSSSKISEVSNEVIETVNDLAHEAQVLMDYHGQEITNSCEKLNATGEIYKNDISDERSTNHEVSFFQE